MLQPNKQIKIDKLVQAKQVIMEQIEIVEARINEGNLNEFQEAYDREILADLNICHDTLDMTASKIKCEILNSIYDKFKEVK